MTYGFDDLRSRFSTQVHRGTVSHAHLLFGDAGVGKWRFARDLAGFLERGTWDKPTAPLLDALFIEHDPERSSIGIDEVRAMKQFLWQTPLSSPFRYVAINDAHLLTPEAQGAMLKVVEEPPSHALLMFVSFDPSTLNAPLRSRLQKVYCPRMSRSELEHVLVSGYGVPPSSAKKVALGSYGRLGRALALAGKVPGDTRPADDPERTFEETIINLHALKLYGALVGALSRESSLKQFNLNGPLQTKALKETTHAPHRQ